MRLGVLLPTFRSSPASALEVAADAATRGLDGIFCYDHLWPMGSPERPAIAPFELLAVVASRHDSLSVGTLVARIGLVDNEVLLSQFRALRLVAKGRVVAGLGTGDRLSREENLAYGIDVAPPAQRREELRRLAGTLLDESTEVWVGSGAAATNAIAATLGCTLNLWNTTVEDLERAAVLAAVSWAGSAPARDDELDLEATASLLRDLDRAGATWAVFSPGTSLGALVEAAELARSNGS
jgi:alkanesulfonate monooxygenase SsuD/methylene tetrahydromethanopterin reductase-like flavin-dependent oxidoreductase (luciferase family)